MPQAYLLAKWAIDLLRIVVRFLIQGKNCNTLVLVFLTILITAGTRLLARLQEAR